MIAIEWIYIKYANVWTNCIDHILSNFIQNALLTDEKKNLQGIDYC